MKRILSSALLAAALALPGAALAAGGGDAHLEDVEFSFDGPFGVFERNAVQRGFQVYREVCSSCHGLKFVMFNELLNEDGPGFTAEDVKALAADYEYQDDAPGAGPDDFRTGRPSDRFPAVTSAGAPDLSLMAKARPNGADYIYSILTSYTGEEVSPGVYENKAMPGGGISMAEPLYEDAVEYADETPATVEQMAEDVATFLQWVSEPHQTQRKRAGMRTIAFMILFAGLLYFSNRKLWKSVKHPAA